MPAAETGKCSTKHDAYACEALVTSTTYEPSRSNRLCKRRRLQKSSVVILSAEEETNAGLSGNERCPPYSEVGNSPNINYVPCSPIKCTKSREAISQLEPVTVSDKHGRVRSNTEREAVTVISRTDFSDATEYPSSDICDFESSDEDHSVKHACINTLWSQELLGVLGISGNSCTTQPCKLCGHSENILNMLICDNCEEAFHVSCCDPRKKMMPIDEWFCHNCSKLDFKVSLEANFLKSRCITLERATSPIASMLKHPEKHTSRVRIGSPFQVEVPDWSGPSPNGIDSKDEALQKDPTETIISHLNSNECSKPNIIANWLQCREVLYDGSGKCFEGTICGKWRRAPLFEIQTDDWDCSCSVLWDPTHSDCAVPQELGTDQVQAHLKALELLKTRLAVKRR